MVMHLGEQGWRWGGNFEICVVFILINMKIELQFTLHEVFTLFFWTFLDKKNDIHGIQRHLGTYSWVLLLKTSDNMLNNNKDIS